MIKRNILDCMTLVGGTPSRYEGEKTYVSTGAVDCDHVDYAQAERVTYDNRPSRANLSVAEGDILFAKMCGTKKTLRIDRPLSEHLYSTGFCAVRANESIMNAALLYHLLASDQFLTQKDQNSSGATQKAITNAGLRKIVIQVPDLSEQRKLAANLDRIERLMAKRREQLVFFDQLVKSRFIELFGDPVSNPKDWNVEPLGNRCGIITGNTPPRSEPENYGKYIEWIKSDNINTPFTFITKAQECLSEAGFEKCRFVEAGSILMTCIAGSIDCIGNVAVTDRRVAFNQQINAIVPEQDEVLYLYWLMQLSKPMIHRTINMALKGILSKSQLSEIVFPFPPITLQEQFAALVEQTDKSKLAVQKSLEELEILKKSLMQQYFG